jgi:hypothetical protein
MAVGIFLVAIAIHKSTHTALTRTFIAVLVTFTTLFVLELLIMEAFFAITNLDPNTTIAENSNVLWKLSGLPQALLLNIFALLVARFKKPKEDAWKI